MVEQACHFTDGMGIGVDPVHSDQCEEIIQRSIDNGQGLIHIGFAGTQQWIKE